VRNQQAFASESPWPITASLFSKVAVRNEKKKNNLYIGTQWQAGVTLAGTYRGTESCNW
jgi:hypothetical protein